MIKTPFESQDQVLYSTQPTLSAIPTLLSATLSPVENGQTLQQFWSPLYIPTTKLVGISNKAARHRALANLYHACMHDVLGSISSYGETGLDMLSGDGVWRRCHPIFAAFIGDYPEQALVTCTYYGHCPKCTVPLTQLGEYGSFPPHIHSKLLDTYQLADSDVHTFYRACGEVVMKPIYHPFWETLPLTDVFRSITPNILHQVHQGMVKHIISWVTCIFGAAAINA